MARPQAAASLTSIDMLARMVAFDTTSRNSNLDLIGFVRTWLDAHEVPYRLSFDPTGRKANLHATIGPVQPGGFALSGHVDTVPTDGQTWTGDPYTLRRDNGRLIGRGTGDMKGLVAATLAAVPDIKARKLPHAVHPDAGFDYQVLLDLAALALAPEHALARAACDSAGAPVGGKLSYCSEGSLFQPAGIACLVCGPGDIAQLHQADEWIAESQLVACDAFIRRMVDRVAA
jgi:acetylornithine deacetylase/succinyl-diaminopimelate desuccinylase-like protein